MDSADLKIGERFQEETKYFRPSAVSTRPDQEPVSFAPRTIPLPPPEISAGPGIWEVLRKRRSTRDYRKEPLNLKELANLLWATQGVTVKAPAPWFRTAPSAGALHPIDTYLVVNQTKGLALWDLSAQGRQIYAGAQKTRRLFGPDRRGRSRPGYRPKCRRGLCVGGRQPAVPSEISPARLSLHLLRQRPSRPESLPGRHRHGSGLLRHRRVF